MDELVRLFVVEREFQSEFSTEIHTTVCCWSYLFQAMTLQSLSLKSQRRITRRLLVVAAPFNSGRGLTFKAKILRKVRDVCLDRAFLESAKFHGSFIKLAPFIYKSSIISSISAIKNRLTRTY